MTPAPFSTSDALRFGWETTRQHLQPLLILGGIAAFLALLQGGLERSPLLSLAVQVVQMMAWLAITRVALRLHDGQPVDLARPADLLAGFWPYLLANVLLALAVVGGIILLIVPGIVAVVAYGFGPFLVVDRGLDPVAALRESRRITRGSRWQVLEFGLLALLVNLVGALALGVGLLVTVPTTYIAAARVLRRLQAHAATAPPALPLQEAHA